VDVDGKGITRNLTEGILRARYRNGQAQSELLSPGRVYKFSIDLWATSNVFLAGHKLRLEIGSSNFPRFDRNLNVGESPGQSVTSASATNTVLHDAGHPSALIVPLVP
jgi:putative CocE/NonD family hydrolase